MYGVRECSNCILFFFFFVSENKVFLRRKGGTCGYTHG